MTPAHLYDLIYELLKKELKVRYKRLVLGYLWSIASPLMYAGLYYLVFYKILKVSTENYPLFLVSSLFPWQWMTNTIMIAPSTYIGNASMVKKMLFPRYLIPVVVAIQDALHYLVSIPVIILFVYIFHGTFSWHWIFGIPALVVVQFTIASSLNLLFATLTVFFRDLERFLQIGIMFLFYMTPVLYSETKIPDNYQWLIIYHPIAPLIINWRTLFMNGTIRGDYLISSLAWGVLLLSLAQFAYRKLSWRFAEVL